MEETIRWIIWCFTMLIPFSGLVWCLTTPVAPSLRHHDVVQDSPER